MRRCRNLRAHRGTILVATLVCLLLTTALIGTMLHAALVHRRQLLSERDVRQTDLLVTSGIRRARYRISVDPDYRGETWQPPLPQLDENSSPPTVKIEFTNEAHASAWQVKVFVENPVSPALTIHRTRTILVPIQIITLQESSP